MSVQAGAMSKPEEKKPDDKVAGSDNVDIPAYTAAANDEDAAIDGVDPVYAAKARVLNYAVSSRVFLSSRAVPARAPPFSERSAC